MGLVSLGSSREPQSAHWSLFEEQVDEWTCRVASRPQKGVKKMLLQISGSCMVS